MWKPKEVVPEHRWRARILWASLLLSIAAYTIWQGWKMYDGYSSPSTSLEVTDETYEFPYVLACFFPGEGCGMADKSTDLCVSNALEFATVQDHKFEKQDGIVVESMWTNCVGFDLTRLNIVDAGVRPDEASVEIDMAWAVTDIASTEVDYFQRISIFLSEEEPDQDNLSFLTVPYSRHLLSDETDLPLTITDLTIGKTTKKTLDGDVTTTFPPLIMSTSTFVAENQWDSTTTGIDADYAFGQVKIRLTQGPFSRTSVKELSPLDLGDFFGNIGGFWELLIVLWGLFFIATRDEDEAPKLRAREFIQPVKEIIRRRSLSVDSGASTSRDSRGEERPHWESAFQGSNPTAAPPPLPARGGFTKAGGTAAAAGFPTMAPANGGSGGGSGSGSGHRRQSNGSSSSTASSRRPVVQDAPRRGSRPGSGVSASQEPTPPSYFDMTRVA